MRDNLATKTAILKYILGVICSASVLLGQFTTVSLGGVVTDASGSTVTDASVTVENVDTGFSTSLLTNSDGAYLFPSLPVSTYRLVVEKNGFSRYVQEGITLVDQAATQSVSLRIGTISQQVTVNANASMVTTETATVGQLVTEKQVLGPASKRTSGGAAWKRRRQS